jgi:hypothetical protein
MGRPWHREVEPKDRQISYNPFDENLAPLVADAYRFNPDWGRLEAGLRATEAQLDEAKSSHKPKVAPLGQLALQANPYDKGIVGPQEDRSWMVGIGLELPLFNGFRTTQEIRVARARIEQRLAQQSLLREGLALQVKAAFLNLERIQAVQTAAAAAAQAATQNRDLNERAYRLELVEAEDMIQSQIVESFTNINKKDAEVAVKVWAKQSMDSMGINAQLEITFYEGKRSLIEAIDKEQIDLISMSTIEYLTPTRGALQRPAALLSPHTASRQNNGSHTARSF